MATGLQRTGRLISSAALLLVERAPQGAEHIRQILTQEQDPLIELATALGNRYGRGQGAASRHGCSSSSTWITMRDRSR